MNPSIRTLRQIRAEAVALMGLGPSGGESTAPTETASPPK